MIVGVGIDIVEVERVQRAVERRGQPFLDRIWTVGEQEFGRGSKGWYESLAGRFAAKEAVLKALGSGLRQARWHEVEVEREPWSAPRIKLHGQVAARAEQMGIALWHLSLSHSAHYAVATAIAERSSAGVAEGTAQESAEELQPKAGQQPRPELGPGPGQAWA